MRAENAAQELEKRLRKFAWYHSVGVGETAKGPMLFVYVKSSRHRELELIKDGWMGYPVIVRSVGNIRPVSRESSREYKAILV
jgi:hypothetical protein